MSVPYPPTAPPATTSSSTVPSSTPISTRNPLPLSAAQEGQVRDLYYKRVRSLCANEIRDFASCALNRTFSATWACRPQRLAMNNCMVAHATVEQQDAARAEWFATKDQRRKEREEKEAKRKEAERLHHEYWGLDEQGRRIWDADKAGGKR